MVVADREEAVALAEMAEAIAGIKTDTAQTHSIRIAKIVKTMEETVVECGHALVRGYLVKSLHGQERTTAQVHVTKMYRHITARLIRCLMISQDLADLATGHV
jgi:hypothetical protein